MKKIAYSVFALLVSIALHAQPLSGNYTINSAQATGGSNYQTFTDFAGDLTADGVSGNVVATVVPGSGPYNEQINIINIPGAGQAATVTIEGSGETITALTTSSDRHVVRLTDVKYFTINNLRIERNPASTGGFYGIHLFSSGDHITISHCSVDISGTNSTLYGAYVASGSLTSILDSGDFHFINIINDTATGGGYGVSVFGKASALATNIVISGNTFYDFHSNGVYLRETDGAEISNNHFDKRNSNITSCNAIQLAQAANINASIFNNFIAVSQTANGTMTFRGIYLFNGTGHKVYNNVIHDIHLTSGNFTGIEVRTGATSPEIYFNTISIDNSAPTTGDLYGISESLSNTNSILRNNIISIAQTTSGTKSGLVLGSNANLSSAFNTDYNLFWVPNGNVAMKDASTPVYYGSLADWQTASTLDANSISVDPQFVSSTLSEPTNALADNLGTPIAWITTDVLGAPRNPVPDIGAYEFPSTIGIEQFSTGNGVTIYPNPGSAVLHLLYNGNEASQLIFYNVISQKQRSFELVNSNKLDVSSLEPGMYLYEVRRGTISVAKGKFVRQ